MDCFGTYFTLAFQDQTKNGLWGNSCKGFPTTNGQGLVFGLPGFTHAQSCDNVRVQSAIRTWTASVHTLHMPKAVITFVFQVLRKGLLRYNMPKAVIAFVFKVVRNGLLRYILYTVQSASGHMLNFRASAFSRFRVFAFSRFRVCTFSCFHMFNPGVFTFLCVRVFAFTRLRVFAFSCFHMFTSGVFAFSCFRVFGFSRFAGGIRVAETQISYAQ